MRKMHDSHGTTIIVIEHLMLRNGWEYYLIEDFDSDGIGFALVYGDFTEMGSVSLDEMRPYIVSRTKNLDELAPCEDWQWVATCAVEQEDVLKGYPG